MKKSEKYKLVIKSFCATETDEVFETLKMLFNEYELCLMIEKQE